MPPSTPQALRRGHLPDPFTYSLYACAPYRGCGHGCAYCDGRAEKYFVDGDFSRDIVLRQDLPERLRLDLPRVRDWGAVCLGSGVTDAYQPCERQHRLTRRLAEAFAGMKDQGLRPLPVVLLTKSSMALEDLDVWTQINQHAAVLVMVSITSLDESVREAFEPNASPFQARLELLRRFKAAGCLTGALVMPLLPGLTDQGPNLDRLFRALKEVHVDFALPGGLTLRPGRQKDHFLAVLRQHHPELDSHYQELYGAGKTSGAPVSSHSKALNALLKGVHPELPRHLPHCLFSRLLAPADQLTLLYQQMQSFYRHRGVDIRPLDAASQRYALWLQEQRTTFRRRRTLPLDWITTRLHQAAKSGELAEVFNNPRLWNLTQSVLRGEIFLDEGAGGFRPAEAPLQLLQQAQAGVQSVDF